LPLRFSPLTMRSRIAKAATIIALGNILSRLLGLVRVQVIAFLFGATAVTDAFTVASNIPTMVYDLLVGGMFSAALIPVFSDYADDPAELGRVTGIVTTLIGLVMAAIAAVLMIGAPQLVQIMGSGFEESTQALAVDLVQVVLPAVVFLGLSGVAMAVLYAREIFTYPAFAAAAFNGGIIVCALLLTPWLGALSLVLGVVAGAFFQMVLQAPGLRGLRIRPSLRESVGHPAVRRILRLYMPVAAGLVISQIGVAIDRNLASQTDHVYPVAPGAHRGRGEFCRAPQSFTLRRRGRRADALQGCPGRGHQAHRPDDPPSHRGVGTVARAHHPIAARVRRL
jgi:putative peptidoglycan lipid II flippase